MTATPPVIDLTACERLVGVAAKACPAADVPAATPVPPAPQPEWDALANSFASLGVALTWGGLLLGVTAIVAGFAWARIVTRNAEEEARKEARECVDKLMTEWKAKELPALVSKNVAMILDTTKGNGNDLTAADRMGEGAGE